MTKKIKLNDITFGDKKSFVLLAGPCVIESKQSVLYHAQALKDICGELGIPFVFKASYDKANRSSVESFRGPGIDEGLQILKAVKEKVGVPVVSDVHTPEEVAHAAEFLDIVQIPAFLSRQTDLLVAAGKTKKIVNVKKGQFLAPLDMVNAVKKIESTGNKKILLTERGTTFGYNNLVSDFRAIPLMATTGYPTVFDVTHSVQIPGGLGNASGGNREFIPLLARCAVVSGVDALFMEVHKDPAKARCDGPNSLKLNNLKKLLTNLLALRSAMNSA